MYWQLNERYLTCSCSSLLSANPAQLSSAQLAYSLVLKHHSVIKHLQAQLTNRENACKPSSSDKQKRTKKKGQKHHPLLSNPRPTCSQAPMLHKPMLCQTAHPSPHSDASHRPRRSEKQLRFSAKTCRTWAAQKVQNLQGVPCFCLNKQLWLLLIGG